MAYCVVVAYRESARTVGPFESYEDAQAWCSRNRSALWISATICPVEMPGMEEPSEEQW